MLTILFYFHHQLNECKDLLTRLRHIGVTMICFNSQHTQLIILDTMKLSYDGNIILGEAPLTATNSYKYLGHIITDNLSDCE